MPDQYTNSLLNDVLITLNRSLLQYLGECSPWSAFGEDAAALKTEELISLQRSDINLLVDVLTKRRSYINYGLYPVTYTDLQFLSLDFLLVETLDNAKQGLQTISTSIAEISQSDHAANQLLSEIESGQRDLIGELEKLTTLQSR